MVGKKHRRRRGDGGERPAAHEGDEEMMEPRRKSGTGGPGEVKKLTLQTD
jgi:hypothetical protein